MAADLLRRADYWRHGAERRSRLDPRRRVRVLVIALIENALVLAKVDPYWVQFALGGLVLVNRRAQSMARGAHGGSMSDAPRH